MSMVDSKHDEIAQLVREQFYESDEKWTEVPYDVKSCKVFFEDSIFIVLSSLNFCLFLSLSFISVSFISSALSDLRLRLSSHPSSLR